MNDEDYLTKQLESQICLKKNLVVKLNAASASYDAAMKKKLEQDALDKVEAYNTWRLEEEKRGKAQDDHGRILVKKMMETVRAAPENKVSECMCSVLGNVDGKLFYKS